MPIAPISNREEYLKKKRNKKLIRYALVSISIVVIVGITTYISHLSQIRISEVTLSGGVLVTAEDVSAATLSFVQGSYLWIFPKDNVMWYPHRSLSAHLKEKFKRIDTIDMHLEDFHTLAIEVTERKPVAIWCDALPGANIKMEDGSSSSGCYFLDEDSTIFAPAPYFSGDAYFKYYGLVTNDNPVGSFYISSSTQFADITHFVDSVKSLSLRPQYLVAKSADEFSLVVAGDGEIYFDTREPLAQARHNLEVLLSKTPALSKNITGVDYIDLRYGNKLFYKMKNQ